MEERLIVSASGVRGVLGEGLTPAVAARYGAAYGDFLRERSGGPGGHVVLARDSRTSGELLSDAASAGLRAAGWDVRDLGVVPTPTALLAVQDAGRARGGLVLTASHNPVEWNGIKMATAAGEFLSGEDGREVQRRFESGPRITTWDDLGDRDTALGAAEHHVERILALEVLDVEAVRGAGLRVALDAVRGAAGPLMVRLLERLGCEVDSMDVEPDGRFPREPEPIPANLGGLGELVRGSGADLGMAVDPDGDRLALVAADGEPIGEDLTLALAAEYVLEREPGPLVTNLSSSRVIRDVADRAGLPVHLAPVGEANVAARMREVGAAIGGEGNGGVMLPALHLTRDAPLAAALVLARLGASGSSLRRLVEARPGYHVVKLRAARPDDPPESVYRALVRELPDADDEDRQDGLRLDWTEERRWLHVRPSGTEPIFRVVAEAPEREPARRLAERALAIVRAGGAEAGEGGTGT